MTRATVVRRVVLASAVAALVVSAACGGSGDAPDARPMSQEPGVVSIREFAFSPDRLRVAVGTTIEVRNEDDAPHTLTAEDRSFDTGTLEKDASKTITIERSGTFPYVCTIHQYMKGELVAE